MNIRATDTQLSIQTEAKIQLWFNKYDFFSINRPILIYINLVYLEYPWKLTILFSKKNLVQNLTNDEAKYFFVWIFPRVYLKYCEWTLL